MSEKKIAFFDIDGTLTSEKDGKVPDDAVLAIRKARDNGHYMFINTGRTLSTIESKFTDIGFDGMVCGCGTNIYYNGEELLHLPVKKEAAKAIVAAGKDLDVDVLFEARDCVTFDWDREFKDPEAKGAYYRFRQQHYDMTSDPNADDFTFDKFCAWFRSEEQMAAFLKVSDKYFTCIPRGGLFREFVPVECSKATGIAYLVEHFGLKLEDAYAFGDSNNDLPMLLYVPHSVAMGNADPEDLKEKVSYVTKNASCGGIAYALAELGFI
jgi:hypothetical protein